MSSLKSNMNASAVTAWAAYLSQKLSDRSKSKAAESQAAAADSVSQPTGHGQGQGGAVNMVDEMILDIESYREQLDKRLEALAVSLSELDQGVAHIESLTIRGKQQDPEILAIRQQEDPFEKMYKELLEQLNKYGSGAFVDAQGQVSADRALSLLEG